MIYTANPTVSVIIPVHNGGSYFRTCLSKLAQAVPRPIEIIVVADGDSDGSWRLAKEFGAKLIRIPESGGPARARNLGAQAAKGDILFFVDADVAVCPEAVGYAISVFKHNPYLAAAIGSYDDAPGDPGFLSQYRNLMHHYVHQTGNEEASTFWGACGLIRREIFLQMGGFNESYRRPSIEDIELGYRLKQAGYKIRLCKTLQVKHLKRWEPISLLRADFFYRALPWTELIWRDRKLNNDLNLQVSSRVSIILTYAMLFSILGTWWSLGCLVLASLLAIPLVVINAPLYRFFWRKHGMVFAIKTIPWHWLYYFYSGLGFAIGTARHVLSQKKSLTVKVNLPVSAQSLKTN
ncbi:MAG: glycosyltransferase [Oscillatoriales cyanobacterium]|nr:MAG: glycosyltransferase [Oscillatoriales cyanobacterium]TAH23678.1 MAG: glycosyltransferase [Oscillatoriales cyanobacterium]